MEESIHETLSDKLLLVIKVQTPWYANFVNYRVCGVMTLDLSSCKQKNFYMMLRPIYGMTHFLSRRCVPMEET